MIPVSLSPGQMPHTEPTADVASPSSGSNATAYPLPPNAVTVGTSSDDATATLPHAFKFWKMTLFATASTGCDSPSSNRLKHAILSHDADRSLYAISFTLRNMLIVARFKPGSHTSNHSSIVGFAESWVIGWVGWWGGEGKNRQDMRRTVTTFCAKKEDVPRGCRSSCANR